MTAVINKRKLKNELLAHLKTLIEESISSQIMIKTSRNDEGYCLVRLHCVRQKDYVRDESRYQHSFDENVKNTSIGEKCGK